MKLGKHTWSPQTIEQVLRLGVEIASYERAAQSFTALTRIGISKSSIQRLVLEYGGRMVDQQAAEAQAMVRIPQQAEAVSGRTPVEPEHEVMAVSADGVMVHLLEEGWKEVKVASISAVAPQWERAEHEGHLTHHSYRAGLWEARSFGHHLWAEACRRGLERAQQVVCVSDGAAWIWALMFLCFARRIEVLDWWHAVARLWTLASGRLRQEEAVVWVAQQKHHLRHQGLRQVLAAVRTLYPRHSALPEEVRQALGYLFTNRRRMRYAAFRHAGLPIGSGTVESACKVVVQQRMKQAGMRWSRNGAQAMLALHSTLLSGRWHETRALLDSPS